MAKLSKRRRAINEKIELGKANGFLVFITYTEDKMQLH